MDLGKPFGCRKPAVSCESVSHTTAGCHNSDGCEKETDKGEAMGNSQQICLEEHQNYLHEKTNGTSPTLSCIKEDL